jgi:hypothetical protein
MHFPRKLKRGVEQPTGFTLGPGAKNFTQKKVQAAACTFSRQEQ